LKNVKNIDEPKVSVIISTYNRANLLPQVIKI